MVNVRTLRLTIGIFIAVIITDAIAQDVKKPDSVRVEYVFEELKVTGSRIRGDAEGSTAPVVIMAREEIKARGLASRRGRTPDAHRAVQRHQYPGKLRW